LKAETLLAGSYVLSQIETLRNSLRYRTNGDTISFDDYYLKLQKEIDDIPRLELKNDVPTGTENQYILQLIKGLESVQDEADRIVAKIIHYQSKLRNAVSRIQRLSASFNAWYTLAAGEALEQNSTKFPSNQLKDLAASEFSRLMEDSDEEMSALLEAVKVQTEQIKLFKKTQQNKFELGKDQANASWTSGLPNFGEAPDRSDQLVARQFEEEPDEDIPDFISKNPQVGTFVPSPGPSTFVSKLPEDTLGEIHDKGKTFEEAMADVLANGRLAGSPPPSPETMEEITKILSVLPHAEPEVETTPYPADSVMHLSDIERHQHEIAMDRTDLPSQHFSPVSEIKGVFAKTGDPKPVTPVYNDDTLAKTVASLTDVFPGAQEVTTEVKKVAAKKVEKTPFTFVPPPDALTFARTETDGLGKLHCEVCGHRIRTNQVMFKLATEEGYRHAWEADCTGKAPVRGQKKDDVIDPAPDTTLFIPGATVHHVVPIAETHTGPVAEGTIVGLMEKAVSITAPPSLKVPPLTPPVDLSVPEPDVPATPRRRLQFIEEGEDIV
jgi:hypothetical protein